MDHEILETLLYYDGPVVYTACYGDELWFGIAHSEYRLEPQGWMLDYLEVKTSPIEVDAIKNNAITLRDVLNRESLRCVSVINGKVEHITQLKFEDLEEMDLPTAGVFLRP